jgi:hypothetical protein
MKKIIKMLKIKSLIKIKNYNSYKPKNRTYKIKSKPYNKT